MGVGDKLPKARDPSVLGRPMYGTAIETVGVGKYFTSLGDTRESPITCSCVTSSYSHATCHNAEPLAATKDELFVTQAEGRASLLYEYYYCLGVTRYLSYPPRFLRS